MNHHKITSHNRSRNTFIKVFLYGYTSLVILQFLLVIGSWLIDVLMPEASVTSLLDGKGIRFLLSSYVSRHDEFVPIASILSVAIGAVWHSGLLSSLRSDRSMNYAHRQSRSISLSIFAITLALVAVLALIPQSPLYNLSGGLFPGPYPFAVIALTSAALIACAVIHTVLTARNNVERRIFNSLTYGFFRFAPWLLLYLMIRQVYDMIIFITQ